MTAQQPDRTDIERTQALIGQRYQLSWIIGRGGMSTVWLARDTDTDRDVAIKILRPEYTGNPEFRQRFRNEAEHAQQFHSPNVVATYDYQEVPENGSVFSYIVMEYVRGEPLSDVLQREKHLTPALALDVIAQTANGLATIHAAGMVHRDIKPGNLLISHDGVVKITDFGIAKAAAAVPLTRTGMVVGTAQYVSPEQAQGDPVTAATDIYSLGIVGYEMLCGKRPFTGENTVTVALQHIKDIPAPLPEDIPKPARELISICLRKKPSVRYHNGAELAAATAQVIAGHPAPPPSPYRNDATDSADAAHPATEHFSSPQLGSLAQGRGTTVPPRQGPELRHDRGGRHRAAGAASGGAAAGAGAAGSVERPAKNRNARIIIGLLAAAALLLGGTLLWAKGSQQPSSNETLTVTSEVTTSPTDNPDGLDRVTDTRQEFDPQQGGRGHRNDERTEERADQDGNQPNRSGEGQDDAGGHSHRGQRPQPSGQPDQPGRPTSSRPPQPGKPGDHNPGDNHRPGSGNGGDSHSTSTPTADPKPTETQTEAAETGSTAAPGGGDSANQAGGARGNG